jgi:hypothetical protein
VHFHVPVQQADHATQEELSATLEALVAPPAPVTRHLEVETYTWSVLPQGPGDDDERLIDGLAGELAWTRDRLVGLGAEALR